MTHPEIIFLEKLFSRLFCPNKEIFQREIFFNHLPRFVNCRERIKSCVSTLNFHYTPNMNNGHQTVKEKLPAAVLKKGRKSEALQVFHQATQYWRACNCCCLKLFHIDVPLSSSLEFTKVGTKMVTSKENRTLDIFLLSILTWRIDAMFFLSFFVTLCVSTQSRAEHPWVTKKKRRSAIDAVIVQRENITLCLIKFQGR